MAFLRLSLAVIGIAFGALIVWAVIVGDFWSEGSWLTTNPWGIVSLADLYFGFLLSAVVIAFFEKPTAAILWILPVPFLGNVWVVVWFIYRLPMLRARLKSR
ncbi:MAG: hypothetical protein AAGI92_00205 [Pseudomonadota bacterium]